MATPLVNDGNSLTILVTLTGHRDLVLVIVSEWTLTLMTSHKKEPMSTLLVYREFMGDGLYHDQWDWMGSKRETWCHFGEAWCHFVWFDWIACLPFCFFFLVVFGCFIGVCVCQRMFAVVFAFIFEDCVLPVSVCHPTQPCKDVFLK